MSRLLEFLSRLVSLFRKSKSERELSEEIRAHIEMQSEENIRRGMNADDARRAAQRAFGGVEQTKEHYRDQRGLPVLEILLQDIRYSARTLAKNPGFALIAVLTLALGIGANTTIFSFVDAVVLQPLPYPDPDRLVSLWEVSGPKAPDSFNTRGRGISEGADQPRRTTVSPANLVDYQKQSTAFTGLSSFDTAGMNLTGAGNPERILGEQVNANYFSILGIHPAQGRSFLPEEDRPGNNHVVIISDDLWRDRFGADPKLLGSSIALNSKKYQVIGIMPAGFVSPSQYGLADRLRFYVPAAFDAELLAQHGDHEVNVLGRLAPGATLQQAQAELNTISDRLGKQFPNTNENIRAEIAPLRNDIVREVQSSLYVLLACAGFTLLIACSNLANLLLARAVSRRREMAVRLALGASRARVVSELVVQCLLLSGIGCAAGLLGAVWAQRLFLFFAPPGIPRLDQVALNSHVLIVASLLSVITAILCGAFPAWQISRGQPIDSLRAGERNQAGASVLRWRNALMVAEIALSMVLLVGAGLLLKSFFILNGVPLGFQEQHVLAMNINLPNTRYTTGEQRFTFYMELEQKVSAIPGVESIAYANRLPMRGGWSSGISLESGTPEGTAMVESDFQAVNPGYFRTLGIPLLRGRTISSQDTKATEQVAVVSSEFGNRFLPGQEVIGRRFRRHDKAPWVTIIGVVYDVRRDGKAAAIHPQVFLSAAQTDLYPTWLADFAVRATVEPHSLLSSIQQAVWAIDKDQPVTNVKTLEEVLSRSLSPRRFQMILLLLFSGVALTLGLVGIYGVVSYSVSQRTPEMGIRMALGAQRSNIYALILRQTSGLIFAGILLGTGCALALSRFLESFLFSVKPTDPATYVALAILLAVVALFASGVPARRATRVNPVIALRYE
ncbi:MAG: ABC transporter permease [Acidobacteria bacterium]|nr:ABC transporter permease [Acidobacteriota bacterium]